ncbi:acetoacetate decarboxylase family protein [Extibacter muris]|uniref:acetoacetate decarboxylase family protein n=1 Tax=Extibacter muris TaxID=1796622 RepID=UPI001D07F110|nr:acetoacetate decarboxylase family protein [Extibacter muris]MCB6203902.1 acetoacetate decarboxylase family protein [Extibacter muris]MCQ4665641.1 acetoacetate decarboxylase family protein [Extibacter muris]MCQ4695127.1 acetoacetate decarboxylase family protein [Extibacter muris]
MSSFVVSKDKVKNFGMQPTLKNMSGIFYLYVTNEGAVKKVLPPPLEFVAPAVIGYYVRFPKKIADDMQISRNGNEVKTKLARHGVTIFECTVDIDRAYNTPDAEAILAINKPGDIVPGGYYVHYLDYMQTEQGNMEFKEVNLAMLLTEHTVKTFEPGKLAEVKENSSADDAYGELEVVAPMAACYFETDGITMKATRHPRRMRQGLSNFRANYSG